MVEILGGFSILIFAIITILILVTLSGNQRRNLLIFVSICFLIRLCNTHNKKTDNSTINTNEVKKKSTETKKYYKNHKEYEFHNKKKESKKYLKTKKQKRKYIIKNDAVIIGARCYDGTKSNSTGRGTCSYHGGVESWIYE